MCTVEAADLERDFQEGRGELPAQSRSSSSNRVTLLARDGASVRSSAQQPIRLERAAAAVASDRDRIGLTTGIMCSLWFIVLQAQHKT
jgi:hypothetical protein